MAVFYFKYSFLGDCEHCQRHHSHFSPVWNILNCQSILLVYILYTSLYIHHLEDSEGGLSDCKWLAIGIQMQGHHDFCSGNANHIRFHTLLKNSMEFVFLYLGLVPGWNYSLIIWRITSVLLSRKAGECHSQSATH